MKTLVGALFVAGLGLLVLAGFLLTPALGLAVAGVGALYTVRVIR